MFDCYTQNVNLEWLCLKCGMSDINSTIFDSSISSEESSSQISTKIKAKILRIMIVNFQGISGNLKEFFENCLLNSNADVVIGSETFFDPPIKNAEFLPPGFTAYRRDRDDGWGGVIIITKSSLVTDCLLYTSPSPRDGLLSRMPSSA